MFQDRFFNTDLDLFSKIFLGITFDLHKKSKILNELKSLLFNYIKENFRTCAEGGFEHFYQKSVP